MPLQPLPAFADNYIWTLTDDAGRGVIVDPGEAAPGASRRRRPGPATGRDPAHPPPRRPHRRHRRTAAPLAGHSDLRAERRPHRPSLPARGRGRRGSQVGDWGFDVMEIPGHTSSHIAFVGHGHLFCGDTLFSLGCGRLFEGTPAQMLASLDRLARLPADTLVCCGHEYTVANAAFAEVVDPENAALRERSLAAAGMRSAGRATLPSSAGRRTGGQSLPAGGQRPPCAVPSPGTLAMRRATGWNASPACGAGRTGFAHERALACARARLACWLVAGQRIRRGSSAALRSTGSPRPATAARSMPNSGRDWPIPPAIPRAVRAGATISLPPRRRWRRRAATCCPVRLRRRCPARGEPADRIRADPVRRKRLQARRTQCQRAGRPVADDRGDGPRPPCPDPRRATTAACRRWIPRTRPCATSRRCTACSPATGAWR